MSPDIINYGVVYFLAGFATVMFLALFEDGRRAPILPLLIFWPLAWTFIFIASFIKLIRWGFRELVEG